MKAESYNRKVTPLERFFRYSPYSIVTIVARIKGDITKKMLGDAVKKAQLRHTNLRVCIREDENQIPYFTSENVKDIPIEIVVRESDDHWIKVHSEASEKPFDFSERPAIRFILVHSQNVSELIILSHHIICDGISLAYLARDLMVYLGEPTKDVEILPNPDPIDLNNLPRDVSMNFIVKFFINRMNKKWNKEKIHFDQEDYEILNETYWKNAKHRIISIELSEEETSSFVGKCKEEKTTVNSALTTAFVGAQQLTQKNREEMKKVGIAGSLRDRLQRPAGEEMGFFAGVVTLDHTYDENRDFWENARRLNKVVQPLYTNKNLFKEGLMWSYLEPAILEAINFKKLGKLVPPQSLKNNKLIAFSKRDDVVSSILKREKMESLDRIFMGTAVTNLTRMNFPRKYGDLELERLIFNPGGAFPLSNVGLVLGAVTCSSKLSLIMEYDESAINTETMTKIKNKAMEFLQNTRD